MSGSVVRNIHRADAGVIPTLHEAQGRSGLMQPYMRWCGAARALPAAR